MPYLIQAPYLKRSLPQWQCFGFALAISFAGLSSVAAANESPPTTKPDIALICRLLEEAADQHKVPKDFFARLIWKESRFDHLAVSPVGAQGIAQFMPYTAKERGLADAFSIEQALPASASFLQALHQRFDNWGLAAAAYNAGPNRVSNWLKNGGFLPLETEDYVLSITAKPVDHFSGGTELVNIPLDDKLGFQDACQRLPVIQTRAVPMARLLPFAWAVQVAGNFRYSAVTAQWNRLRKQHPKVLAGREIHISRIRSPLGRKGIYAGRIGVDTRQAAEALCDRIRAGAGSCVIRKNR